MTREEIVEVVSAYKAAHVAGRRHGVGSSTQCIHHWRLDDLKLAAEIYGGEIRYHGDPASPFHALDIGNDMTLFT